MRGRITIANFSRMPHFCVLACLLCAVGCTSPFVKLYQPAMIGQHFDPVAQVTIINVGNQWPETVRQTLAPDSVLVGRSSFVSTRAGVDGVEDFAKKIGSNLVLIQSRFERLVHNVGYTTVTNTDTTYFTTRSDSGEEFHGTATTHHHQTVPYAYTDALYLQEALYLRATTLPTQAQVSQALLGETDDE